MKVRVEFVETNFYVVDVEVDDYTKAEDVALDKWTEEGPQDHGRYYTDGDLHVSNVSVLGAEAAR